MSLNIHKIQEELESLRLLGPEVNEIIELASTSAHFIEIPDPSSVYLSLEDLASLVARTSNAFGRAAILAGWAKSKLKRAEGAYKHKYKLSRRGNNETERERTGMEAAEAEYLEMTLWESVVELANSLESAARIASESARKIYVSGENQVIAYNRELKGKPKESDWNNDF